MELEERPSSRVGEALEVFGSQKRNPIGKTAALHVELAEAIKAGNHVDAQNISRRVLLDSRDEAEQLYR